MPTDPNSKQSGSQESLPLSAIVSFVLGCAFLAFVAGLFIAVLGWFPSNHAASAISALRAAGKADAVPHYLYPQRTADAGVTVREGARMQDGVTLVSGMWPDDVWHPQARLLDSEGNVLHSWSIRPDLIWPETPHTDFAAGGHNVPSTYVHGLELLPGGDIVFNIEYLGMVRMDACGEVVWKLPYRTHHSLQRNTAGNFWAAGLHWREAAVPEYSLLKAPFVDETMVEVSPDGEILQEIFILESLTRSGYESALFNSRRTMDFTHMNDVEELSAEMAPAFPMFSAGDLLVSLRNLSLVVVVDGETHEIKWHFALPITHQHDPDFEPDGTIVIFDNRTDKTLEGDYWGRTRLLKVDPATSSWTTVYPTDAKQSFYTRTGGKHQLLENGNRLIIEANAGRVFEVTPAGETVWNWVIDSREGEYIPEVLTGHRYPQSIADSIVCNQ